MYYSEEMIASGRIKFIIKGIVLLALGTQIILLVYQPYRQHRQHRIPNASINERYRCVTHDIERANIVTSIDGKFFLFSAIFVNISDEALNTYQCKQGISVQLWEYNVPKEENAFCCYVLQNSSEYCDEVQHRIVDYAFDIPLHSAHYICRTSEPESNIRSLTIISNATLRKKKKVNSLFHKQYRENYISISPSLIGHKEGLAICSQITYRDTKAATLIEWFEAQKLLGVDKIMTHSYNLNSDAMRVLEYYEQEGFLVLIRGFAFPLKDKYKRDVGDANPYAWTDKHHVIQHCQSRFYGYKYIALLDKDEFWMPNPDKFKFSMKSYLDAKFGEKTVGIRLNVRLHITNWGMTNKSSSLFVEQYINGTVAVPDRTKYIIMPNRAKLGTMDSHYYKSLDGFVEITVDPNDLVIHHYRRCRPSFTIGSTKDFFFNKTMPNCKGIKRSYQQNMKKLIDKIRDKVFEVRKRLNIQ